MTAYPAFQGTGGESPWGSQFMKTLSIAAWCFGISPADR